MIFKVDVCDTAVLQTR